MAIPIALGLIDKFSVVFIALMIFAITYGVLSVSNVFKGAKNLYGIISLGVTFLALINSDFVKMLTMILPWVAFMIIFLFIMFFVLQFLGLSQESILTVMGGEKKLSTLWWVFGALIFLVIWSLGSIMGQRYLEAGQGINNETVVSGTNLITNSTTVATTSTQSFHSNLTNVLFHPAVLGFAVLMIISMMALLMLTRDF